MTEPKKVEEAKDSKKPEAASTDAPKKDEATAQAASNTTETAKTAEPDKTIVTKSEGIKSPEDQAKADAAHKARMDAQAKDEARLAGSKQTSEEAAAKVAEQVKAENPGLPEPKEADPLPEPDPDYKGPEHGDPETVSDDELKAMIGEVAFQSDANTFETTLAPAAPVKGSAAAAAPSVKRLKSLVYAYPKDAKDGTVVFGYGGISITIGDLRAVVSIL